MAGRILVVEGGDELRHRGRAQSGGVVVVESAAPELAVVLPGAVVLPVAGALVAVLVPHPANASAVMVATMPITVALCICASPVPQHRRCRVPDQR